MHEKKVSAITAHRVAVFSDAVIAVIMTVMVLELRAPDNPAFSALWPLWPTIVSYAVSYLFIAIIWINHHYLMWREVLARAHPAHVSDRARRMARRRSLAVLAIFAAAVLVALVAPRLAFALVCGALLLHLRPEAPGSRP